MSDLISISEVIDIMCNLRIDNVAVNGKRVTEYIKELPTVKAKPVVHGYWIENTAGYYVCSNCRQLAKGDMTGCFKDRKFRQERTDFCPSCGADMRGEKND